MSRQFGSVNWFNDSRGYGYIDPDNGEAPIFAHYTAIKGEGFKTLAEGQRVSFVTLEGPKGPQAMDIEREQS